jgi:glycosyltransferase involved in cell wall biosynthesis
MADIKVKMNTLISAIIPTFNSKQYVCEAVDSVLTQTYPNVEVVVIDDGSTDGTGDLLKSKYGNRIKYIVKPNGGPASARNLGIRNSRGEFIAFLDADDLWKPEKLERQIVAFSEETLLVGCSQKTTNDGIIEKVLFRDLVIRNRFSNSGVVVRRRAIEQAGYFDERPEMRAVEDWDMWIRLARSGELRVLHCNLVDIRVTENSISAPMQAEKMLNNELLLLGKVLKEDVPFYLGAQAYSYRYFCASWAYWSSGNPVKARECLFKAVLADPLFVFSKNFWGMLITLTRKKP